jgi:hypothetical protein
VFKRLVARVHCVRPEFRESGSCYLQHDNAPAHSSGFITQFLAKRWIPVLSHLYYSPNLGPADLIVFHKLKNSDERDEIRGCFIDPADCEERNEVDMRRNVSRAFDSLYEKCKRCAEAGGDCIE